MTFITGTVWPADQTVDGERDPSPTRFTAWSPRVLPTHTFLPPWLDPVCSAVKDVGQTGTGPRSVSELLDELQDERPAPEPL